MADCKLQIADLKINLQSTICNLKFASFRNICFRSSGLCNRAITFPVNGGFALRPAAASATEEEQDNEQQYHSCHPEPVPAEPTTYIIAVNLYLGILRPGNYLEKCHHEYGQECFYSKPMCYLFHGMIL
jgi:hypothetical protein